MLLYFNQVNRLSWNIPNSFLTATNVNILNGNLFQCNQDSKPEHDPSSATYVCGSSNFDNSLILFIATLLVVMFLIVWLHRHSLAGLGKRTKELFVLFPSLILAFQCDVRNVISFVQFLNLGSVCFTLLTGAYLLLVAMSYVAMKESSLSLLSTLPTQCSTLGRPPQCISTGFCPQCWCLCTLARVCSYLELYLNPEFRCHCLCL